METQNIPRKRKAASCLSFLEDEEEVALPLKFFPNPDTNKKQSEESKLIEEIKEKYEIEKNQEGQELIELTFAYWDGTNGKHLMTISKNSTISDFLKRAKDALLRDYPHLEHSTNLMYVKEDRIIPSDYTFLDLLLAKAEGSKGPLLKLVKNGDVYKDHGYAGKILERKWYEKNKHIFPACKWKLFEPE